MKYVFQFFTPLKADYDFRINAFEYYGFSEHFREIKEAEMYPQYDFSFFKKEDGTVELKGVTEVGRH